jgi:metal-responsive CopG/Arc/MetJ family transcriptional regulator
MLSTTRVLLPADLVAEVDHFCASHECPPSRARAIAHLVRQGLAARRSIAGEELRLASRQRAVRRPTRVGATA